MRMFESRLELAERNSNSGFSVPGHSDATLSRFLSAPSFGAMEMKAAVELLSPWSAENDILGVAPAESMDLEADWMASSDTIFPVR